MPARVYNLMKCFNCSGEHVIIMQKPLCKNCLLQSIEKRVKKSVRDWPSGNMCISDGSFEQLARYFLDRLMKTKYSITTTADQVISPLSAEDLSAEYLQSIFSGKFTKTSKIINLFRFVSGRELETASKLLGLPVKSKKHTQLTEHLHELFEKDNNLVFGLLASKKQLEN